MNDARRARRIEVPLLVEYRHAPASAWRRAPHGVNLSLTGVSIEVAEEFEAGTTLELRLKVVGGGQPVTATTRTVWTKAAEIGGKRWHRTGLEFTEVNARAIRRLIEDAYRYWREVTR